MKKILAKLIVGAFIVVFPVTVNAQKFFVEGNSIKIEHPKYEAENGDVIVKRGNNSYVLKGLKSVFLGDSLFTNGAILGDEIIYNDQSSDARIRDDGKYIKVEDLSGTHNDINLIDKTRASVLYGIEDFVFLIR